MLSYELGIVTQTQEVCHRLNNSIQRFIAIASECVHKSHRQPYYPITLNIL